MTFPVWDQLWAPRYPLTGYPSERADLVGLSVGSRSGEWALNLMHPKAWLGSHRPDAGSDPDLEIAFTQHKFEVNGQCGKWIARITTVSFSVGRREGSAQCVSSREVSRDHTHIVAVGDGYELHDRDSYYKTFVKAEEGRERGFVHGGHFKLGRTGGAELGQRLVPFANCQRFTIGT